MAVTSNLALTLLDPGQNQKEVTINTDLIALDALLVAFVSANSGKLVGIAAGGISQALGLPSILSITGGNLVLTNQTKNLVLAGPASGSPATPTMRALQAADLPVVPNTVVVLTDAATIAVDASLGTHMRVTLGGNRTLGNPTNPTDGQRILFEIIQDGTGSRTITLSSKYALGTDIASVTLTTTASKRDFLGVIYNSAADKWFVVAFVKGY